MAAPQTLDVLARYMVDAFDETLVLNQPLGFQRFFGRTETMSFTHFSPNANDLDIEITRADERHSALVPRGTLGTFLTVPQGQTGQSTWFSRKYPLVVDVAGVTGDQINNRFVPGEGPYEGLNREIRLQRYLNRDIRIMIQRAERAFERLAMQSVTLGKQSVSVFGTPGANDYDWRRNTGNTISLTHGWGNASGTPLTDMDTAATQVRTVGHMEPDMALFGATALLYFMQNAVIQGSSNAPSGGYASHIYWDFVQFNMNFQPDAKFQKFIDCGFRPVGKLRTPAGFVITIFTYPEWYNDPTTGTATKYLNDQYAVVCSSMARADRYFGPPEQLPLTTPDMQKLMERFGFNPMLPPIPRNRWGDDDVIAPQMFYLDGYENENRTVFTPRLQAAPVFPTTQTDAFVLLSNAGTTS